MAVADVGDVSTYLLKLEVVKKEQPSTLVDVTAVVNDEPSVSLLYFINLIIFHTVNLIYDY